MARSDTSSSLGGSLTRNSGVFSGIGGPKVPEGQAALPRPDRPQPKAVIGPEMGMPISGRNAHQLAVLRDIYEVSELCATRTSIWAGLARDVLAGEFLREHGNVEGFTLNQWAAAALYFRPYTSSFFMLLSM